MSQTSGDPPYFPWRGWAFHSYRNRDLLVSCIDEALLRAADHGVSMFELGDYACEEGIVDAIVAYRGFGKLKSNMPEPQRQAWHAYYRELARKVKDRGLELNCWYHVFRDAPRELGWTFPHSPHADVVEQEGRKAHPEAHDVDSGFIWDFVASSIDEFFDLMPEVDRIVLTSLNETPSIMNSGGSLSREDRLLKLYMTIYNSCKAHGKGLVIRDFIVRQEDFEAFLSIMNRLPGDIIIMTKDVLGDWMHLGLPLTPYLVKYMGRKFVVEMDIYGEYWGRLDVPCCIPEHVHHVIRELLPFHPLGVTARVLHENGRYQPRHFATIFESPNDVNVYAMARFLRNPGYILAPGQPWHADYGQMDDSLWIDWAKSRYGEKAAVKVVKAFRRAERIIRLTFDSAGLYDQSHSHLTRYAMDLEDRIERVGIEMLRDEKDEALHLAENCLSDIEQAAGSLKPDDCRRLKDLFEGVIVIVKAFRVRLDLAHLRKAHRESRSGGREDALAAACRGARELADGIRARFGEKFYGCIAGTLENLAADFSRE